LADRAFETEGSWAAGEGWSIEGGVAAHAPSEKPTALKQTLGKPLVPGDRYRAAFRIVDVESGTVSFRLTRGTPVDGTPRDSAGTYVEEVVAASRHPVFAIIASADFVGRVAEASLMRLPSEAEEPSPAGEPGTAEPEVFATADDQR
jgi:hypothetical protein